MPVKTPRMSIKNVNLTAVASQADVSIATVSRVLNGSTAVAPATREKVLKASSDLGYVPDPRFRLMGRSRTGPRHRSRQIGVLAEAVDHSKLLGTPYYMRMLDSLEQAGRNQGLHLITSTLDADYERFLPTFIKDLNVDGVVCTSAFDEGMNMRLKQLVPVVTLNHWLPANITPQIVPDEDSGIRQAMDYLVSLGHRRIMFFSIFDRTSKAFIETPQHHMRRMLGFKRYIAENGLDEAEVNVLPGRTLPLRETMQEQLLQWLARPKPPTAVIFGADVYAIDVISIAGDLKIPLPEKLSIIGNDDTEYCDILRPRLTSIRQPLEAMAMAAMRALTDMLDHPDTVPTLQTMDVTLIKRDSCARV